jgi:hypothetical protein
MAIAAAVMLAILSSTTIAQSQLVASHEGLFAPAPFVYGSNSSIHLGIMNGRFSGLKPRQEETCTYPSPWKACSSTTCCPESNLCVSLSVLGRRHLRPILITTFLSVLKAAVRVVRHAMQEEVAVLLMHKHVVKDFV